MLPSSGVGVVQGEHLQPGDQLHRELHDRAPDPVLVESMKRKVLQPGVFRVTDAVFATGSAVVSQYKVGQLVLLVLVAYAVVRSPSRSVRRSRAPGCGLSLRTMTRIPSGQPDRSSIPVASAI